MIALDTKYHNALKVARDRRFYQRMEDGSHAVLSVMVENTDDIVFLWVEKIYVPANYCGQGIGSNLLSQLCDMADDYDLVIGLSPSAFGHCNMSNSELEAWYERYGFEWDDFAYVNNQMFRQPNQE